MKKGTKITLLMLAIVASCLLLYSEKADAPAIPNQPMQGPATTANLDGSANPNGHGASQAKINIDAVCQGALAYMTFKDGASANAFVAECKEGKHPEVIERYKADMNLGDPGPIE
jgi:hypothetical protein